MASMNILAVGANRPACGTTRLAETLRERGPMFDAAHLAGNEGALASPP
jgi:hypothetical protein